MELHQSQQIQPPIPSPAFPLDWVEARKDLQAISPKLKALLIYLVKMEMENTLCRAEGGHDTLEEVRQELADYRVLQGVLRHLKGEGGV